MPKRNAEESKEDKWVRKMQKYEKKLARKKRFQVIYSSDEDVDVEPQDIQESCTPILPDDDKVSVQPELIQPESQVESMTQDRPGEVVDTAPDDEAVQSTEVVDPDLLQALGDFEEDAAEWGENINENLAKRWEPILKEGLKQEIKIDLKKKYQIPKNCALMKSPALNPEIAAILNDSAKSRDSRIHKKQEQLGCAMAILGKTMSGILTKSIDTTETLRLLSDAAKLFADSHYSETETRRSLVVPMMDKNFIEPFKDRKRDKYLFGDKLGDFVKSSRGIRKTGQLLQSTSTPVNNNLNWRTPPSRPQPRGPRSQASRAAAGGARHQLLTPPAAYRHRAPAPPPPPPPPPPPMRRAQPTAFSRRAATRPPPPQARR